MKKIARVNCAADTTVAIFDVVDRVPGSSARSAALSTAVSTAATGVIARTAAGDPKITGRPRDRACLAFRTAFQRQVRDSPDTLAWLQCLARGVREGLDAERRGDNFTEAAQAAHVRGCQSGLGRALDRSRSSGAALVRGARRLGYNTRNRRPLPGRGGVRLTPPSIRADLRTLGVDPQRGLRAAAGAARTSTRPPLINPLAAIVRHVSSKPFKSAGSQLRFDDLNVLLAYDVAQK